MKKEILESRYNDVTTVFSPIDETSGVITSNGHYVRVSTNPIDDRIIRFIDFEGGPMISVGDNFQDKKIKSIKASYLIEFE